MPLSPTAPGNFESDPFLGVELQDVIDTMEKPDFNGRYAILKYLYSGIHDKLFYILGNESRVYSGEVTDKENHPIDARQLLAIYQQERSLFSDAHKVRDIAMHRDAHCRLFTIWLELYELFVKPVRGIRGAQPCKDVLYSFKATIGETVIVFNLSMIYDLSFRFGNMIVNEPLYFSLVRNAMVAEYFEERLKWIFPVPQKITFLNGLIRQSTPATGDGELPDDDAKKMKRRDYMLDMIAFFIEAQGGQYKELRSIEEFDALFSSGNERNVIQLFTHFHNELVFTTGGYIFLSDLLELIENKKTAGDFNDTLLLDANTCNNFNSFDSFREAGIGYIHYSRHDISTDLAILTLFEMHTGRIARCLGWNDNYLNGTRHFHIIYSDISRAHYVSMNLFHHIKLPTMYDHRIQVEGPSREHFFHYLKEEQDKLKKQKQPVDFDFKGDFKENKLTMGMDLVSILLYGAGSSLAKLLISYLLRNINNDIVVKVKGKEGNEVTMTFRNRTEAEIEDTLRGMGLL